MNKNIQKVIRGKKHYSKLKSKQRRFAYSSLIIPLIILGTFTVVPTIMAGYYSLTEFNMITLPRFIGLANFIELFSDPIFIIALKNTTVYMVACVILQLLLSLGLAMIVTRKWLKGKEFFRSMYFVPFVLSMVIVAIVWRWIFDARVGLLNAILNSFGIASQPWLKSTQQALLAIIIISVWKYTGYNIVIFTAAIQNIPIMYYEAAAVDGSNGWTDFYYITLPLLAPTILYTTITSAIGSFQVFDAVYVITQGGGGPNFSTMTLLVYLYKHSFDGMRFGYGSAASIVMFIILLVLTFIQLRIGRSSEQII